MNEYFALSSLFCWWPLWFIYHKILSPSSAGRINRFLLGWVLVSTTKRSKCLRNVNQRAGTAPRFELPGFLIPRCLDIWVLCTAVSTSTSLRSTGCMWPLLACSRVTAAAAVLLPCKPLWSGLFDSHFSACLFVPFLICFGCWKYHFCLLWASQCL